MAFIAQWRTADSIVDEDTFKNYVAWWMVETVALQILDEAVVDW